LFGFLSNSKFFIIFGSDCVQQIACEEATGFAFENEIVLFITRIAEQPNAVFLQSDLKTELKNLHKGCLTIEELFNNCVSNFMLYSSIHSKMVFPLIHLVN
jgi:hypothetical protein